MSQEEIRQIELQKAFDKIIRYLKTLPENEDRDDLLESFSYLVKESEIKIPPKYSIVEVIGNNGESRLMYSAGCLDIDDSLYAIEYKPFKDYECHSWRIWKEIK